MSLLLSIALVIAVPVLGLTDAELAQIEKGQVPTRTESFTNAQGKSVGRGVGAIVIERSVFDAWAVLSRYEDRAEYIPRLKSVAILERQPSRLRIRQEIDATVKTVRYTAWFEFDPSAHTIHWQLDKTAADNNIADVDGDYRMVELAPGRTLLVYRTYVDTGLRVSASIQAYIARRSIPDLLKSIKQRIEGKK